MDDLNKARKKSIKAIKKIMNCLRKADKVVKENESFLAPLDLGLLMNLSIGENELLTHCFTSLIGNRKALVSGIENLKKEVEGIEC